MGEYAYELYSGHACELNYNWFRFGGRLYFYFLYKEATGINNHNDKVGQLDLENISVGVGIWLPAAVEHEL